MADQPTWMRLLLRAERAVSEPLNRASNSDEAAGVLLLAARGARTARNLAEGTRAVIIHALDLPSHRDVQQLDAKVERLQRTVDDLAAAPAPRKKK